MALTAPPAHLLKAPSHLPPNVTTSIPSVSKLSTSSTSASLLSGTSGSTPSPTLATNLLKTSTSSATSAYTSVITSALLGCLPAAINVTGDSGRSNNAPLPAKRSVILSPPRAHESTSTKPPSATTILGKLLTSFFLNILHYRI